MKTILVIYILAFVSIIVLYVHDHRSEDTAGFFDPREAVAEMQRLEPAPEDFETEGTPGSPNPVTVAPKGSGEAPRETPAGPGPVAETEMDFLPQTFEGLDEKIRALSERARTDPDLYVDIAQCYNIKADMYLVGILELRVLESDAGPEEKYRLANRQELLEGMRIKSLWQAIGALKKVPRNVYRNTDVRWLRAMIYLDLPNQHPRAIAELKKLARDPKAIPELRRQAREKVEEYEKKLRK